MFVYVKPSFRKQWVGDLSLVLDVFLFQRSLNQNVGSFKINYWPGQTQVNQIIKKTQTDDPYKKLN